MIDIKEQNKQKTAKLRLVVIDETKHWSDELQKACGAIKTVYLYDKGKHTFCSEIQPSYYLIPLYSFADTEEGLSDETFDALMQNDEGSYWHVSAIDKMKSERASFSYLEGGLRYYSSEGKKYKEIIETAKEYLLSNHPY